MKLPFLKYILGIAIVICAMQVKAQMAWVQFANNSADQSLRTIDIWVDSVQLANNLDFRTVTGPVELMSGTMMNLIILDSSSTDTLSADSMFVDSFTTSNSYLVLINGLVDSTLYSPFESLYMHKLRRKSASTFESYTDVAFINGCTDAALNVVESRRGLGTILDSFSFGEASGYMPLESDDYRLQTSEDALLAENEFKLLTRGFSDSAIVVVGSGFVDPSSNNNGSSFKWMTIPDGAGNFGSLPASTARVQFIHNSGNPALDKLDVYVNDELKRNGLNYRSKTGFIEVPSALEVLIGITTDSLSGPSNYIVTDTVTLAADQDYRMILNGVSGFNFTPNQHLRLSLIETGGAAQNPAQTDIRIVQGATDVTTLRVQEIDLLNTTWISEMPYDSISAPFQLTSVDYKIRVRDLADTLDKVYALPLNSENFQGNSLLMVTSGFLDTLNNSNGEPFGVFLADSNSGPMMELSIAVGQVELEPSNIQVYPNPFNESINLLFEKPVQGLELMDMSGRVLMQISQPSNKVSLSTEELQSGPYLIDISTSDSYSTHLVIKQ